MVKKKSILLSVAQELREFQTFFSMVNQLYYSVKPEFSDSVEWPH